jgi:SAM-dependent methyltransferase
VGSQPVIVDFESSLLDLSALERRSGASDVARGASINRWGWLRNLYARPSTPSRRFAERLRASLRGRSRRPTLLIIGGGTLGPGLRTLYDDPDIDVISFDLYESPWTRFVADAHAIPLADSSVDAVWIQAVLEHVLDPWRVVAEIERVLFPGGVVYAETPFLQQVHEGPYDFTRFTESGHRWLFRRFERLDSGVVAGPGTQMAWSVEHLVAGLVRSRTAGRAARLATFWLQWLDPLIPESYAVDGASCVYFFGRRTDSPLAPDRIVAHYRGAQATRA